MVQRQRGCASCGVMFPANVVRYMRDSNGNVSFRCDGCVQRVIEKDKQLGLKTKLKPAWEKQSRASAEDKTINSIYLKRLAKDKYVVMVHKITGAPGEATFGPHTKHDAGIICRRARIMRFAELMLGGDTLILELPVEFERRCLDARGAEWASVGYDLAKWLRAQKAPRNAS